jgi:uncharacterized membrane protein YsdA (DUF1294 family)
VAGTGAAQPATVIALSLGRLILLGVYGSLSLALFVMYGLDKAAARRGRRRTPEITLHAVSLAGGWPGALIAQRVFHHKTRKTRFQLVFWGTVIANCLALAWLWFTLR